MPQSLSQLYAHLIFSTKDRFPFLKDDIRERVQEEYRDFLNRYRIEFDEQYVWD